MRTLILNQTNVVGGNNNKLVYQTVQGGIKIEPGDQICLTTLNMYYSWFNFNNALYNNTSFTYTWVDGNTYTVSIPNSNLNIDELNAYFRSVMTSNLHYVISSTGDLVYFLELQLNASRYAVQFNAFLVPTSAQATTLGYTQPVGATWVYPVSAITAQINILASNNFGSIIGFNPGTYPAAPSASNYSKLSDNAPQVSPVSSIIMTCSLINNDITTPETLLYSFTPSNVPFGAIIEVNPPEFCWIEAKTGYYSQFVVELLDQNLQPFQIQDPQMVIILGIRKRSEYLSIR